MRPATVTLDLDLKSPTRDAETITEVCSGGELPEVEIISLLEEQIPRYKLRADTLTEFAGYENQDWFIPSPALKLSDEDLKLSPDQIRETLNYFLLCSNRVSQMTKTYNDIEAVTRLLEEKEKDIELTARIGKDLLTYNTKLEGDVVSLQAELKSANEKITQLSHEMHKKAELIQVLTNDMDETGSESGTPTGIRSINLDLMQKRIGSLEDENRALRREYSKLADDTDECEAQEQRLVNDITLRLATVNMDIGTLQDELERQKEENRMQHEQILTLQAKLSDAEMRLHKFTMENEEVSGLLSITKENQASLATELVDFKERYEEVVGLLRDTQEQLRKQRRKGMPTVRGGALYPYLSNTITGQPDSLQSELESSMYSELSVDSGISNNSSDKAPSYKKVFETVRCASRSSLGSSDGSMYGGSVGSGHNQGLFPRAPPHIHTHTTQAALSMSTMMTTTLSSSGQARMSSYAQQTQQQPRRYSGSMYSTGSLGYPSLDSAGHSDNESQQSEDYYPAGPQTGIPGVPGATELEAALRRLTPAEVSARRATLQHSSGYGGYDSDGNSYLPFGCRTPDSIMSTGSSGLSAFSHSSGNAWKLPEKLQIVKPLEGSQTLHHWAQLATPTLYGLLDERPGVKIRGGRDLEDIGVETYALSDLEEDDEYGNPGKQFDNSSCVYTYTMSTVMHPDDGTTSVTNSVRGSRLASMCPSEQNTAPPTPTCLSRRNSTSTFSTTLGLAKMLNERGIKAVTPSALSTPSGINSFTPTATPCNSPDGTPPPSRSSSPPPSYGSIRLPGILGTGAELLRRTISGDDRNSQAARGRARKSKLALSRNDKKALSGMRIVEKIERIGLDSIMAVTTSTLSPLALQGALYTRRSHSSPMAQLTCLKTTMSPSTSQEQLQDKHAEIMAKKPPLPPSSQRERTPAPCLGVPGKPGTGVLNKRLEQLAARQQRRQSNAGGTRPDLGQVLGTVPSFQPPNGPKTTTEPTTTEQPSLASSTLGTISSLLFGRKGGLL